MSLSRIGLGFSALAATLFVILGVWVQWLTGEYFRPIAALVSAVTLLLTSWLLRRRQFADHISGDMAAVIELCVGTMLALNGLGAVGWYAQFHYYDSFLHFGDPLAISFIVSVVLQPYFPQKRRYIALGVALLTVGLVLLWEFWEQIGDAVLGTMMAGQAGEGFDTMLDIGLGVGGLLIGVLLGFYYHRK